jgi:hypothetical protein
MNNEYVSRPNAILESYRELPPDTSLAYGPASGLALNASLTRSKESHASALRKYEDQVVPALKGQKRDLEDQIADYER